MEAQQQQQQQQRGMYIFLLSFIYTKSYTRTAIKSLLFCLKV